MKMNIKERRLKLWKMRQEEEGYDVSEVNTLEDAEHFFDKQPKVKKEKKQPKAEQPKVKKEKKQPKAEQPKVKKEETSEGDKIENQEENPDDSQKENETESQIQDENSDTDIEDITVSNPTLESPLE